MRLLFKKLIDNGVDLFVTDPPWDQDSLPLYTELGKLAQQKLKPGGFCLVQCGVLCLDQVMARLAESLDWYWLFAAQFYGGNHAQIRQRNISNSLRPILAFTKRPAPNQPLNVWITDLVQSPKAEKGHDRHGQSAVEAQYYIENLTLPGELVVDPFVGGGTIPEICALTGRRFVGTELNPGIAAAARARVEAARLSLTRR